MPIENHGSGDGSIDDAEAAAVTRGGRRRGRRAARGAVEDAELSSHTGFPTVESMLPVLKFFILPGLMFVAIILAGSLPKIILYPVALVLGIYVFASVFRGVDLVLACLLLYIPFSTTYVIPIAPGINGTNALLILAALASIIQAQQRNESWFNWLPGTTMVLLYAGLTCFSVVLAVLQPYGYSYIVHNEFHSVKGWVDQFIAYFIILSCIRDRETAKRVVLYMCIGSMMLVVYAVPEMLEKMGRSTIDKSRVEGPQRQSNNFGGFVAYSTMLLLGLFYVFMNHIKAWLLTPYFLVGLKVLISSFSRGAYLALLAGGFIATWYRGKGFMMLIGAAGLAVLIAFPGLIPESIMARMDSVIAKVQSREEFQAPELDKSSQDRFILWKAAGDMTLESPLFGKGFKGFQKLKNQYTEVQVRESDPHNMYLYIASQMGIPALSLFLMLIAFVFFSARRCLLTTDDQFIRAAATGIAAAAAAYAVVNMFGSRAVNLEFALYFWTMMVCIQVFLFAPDDAHGVQQKRPRGARQAMVEAAGQVASVAGGFAAGTTAGAEADSPRRVLGRRRARASGAVTQRVATGKHREARVTARDVSRAERDQQQVADAANEGRHPEADVGSIGARQYRPGQVLPLVRTRAAHASGNGSASGTGGAREAAASVETQESSSRPVRARRKARGGSRGSVKPKRMNAFEAARKQAEADEGDEAITPPGRNTRRNKAS